MVVDSTKFDERLAGVTDFAPSPTRRFELPLQMFLAGAVSLVLIIAVMRVWICWANDRYVDHAAGAWIALAADLKNGVFYRPLLSASGYGGTRYFPLYFVLYALLLRLGLPVLLSGYFLSAAAMVSLIAGTFYLVRKLGAEPWLATCSAGAILSAYSVQLSLLTTRADGLASAFNVWGIAVIANPRRGHLKILLASLLFTLAWSTKVTTVFGFAAAFLWLLFAGSSRIAWELAAETACGYAVVIGAMVFASQGRIIQVLKACAFGGSSPLLLGSGPWHMLNIAGHEDPGLLLFLFVALLALSVKSVRNLAPLFFIGTLAITMVIFGSPGANFNHLLDVQVAAVILSTCWAATTDLSLLRNLGIYAIGLATLLAAIPVAHKLRIEDRMIPRHRLEKAITFIGDMPKPMLSENPALPVLAGQPPYVMDPFMLRLLRERFPSLSEPLLQELRNRSFSAVVLSMRDPRTDEGRKWYEEEHFGPGFLSALDKNYRLASVINGQFIYLPTTESSQERSTGEQRSATQ